jgi:hypothetical protein
MAQTTAAAAGVMEDGAVRRDLTGTRQGGVISQHKILASPIQALGFSGAAHRLLVHAGQTPTGSTLADADSSNRTVASGTQREPPDADPAGGLNSFPPPVAVFSMLGCLPNTASAWGSCPVRR